MTERRYSVGSRKTVTDPFLGKVELTCTGATRLSAMGEARLDSVWVDMHLNVWILIESTVGADHPPVVLRRELAELVAAAVRPAITPVPSDPVVPAETERRKFPPMMDIWSPKGTRVTPVYVDGKPQGGYPHHAETVKRYLAEGAVYTVERTEVDRCHTDVFLQEVLGVAFNSVCFTSADVAVH